MPRAVGFDYVPYNGFKAELHRDLTTKLTTILGLKSIF